MSLIEINTGIFPKVITFSNETIGSIDLPCDANILYLKSISDPIELNLLKKFSDKETFSDEDYRTLFNLFLNDTPRLNSSCSFSKISLEIFGITPESINNKVQFKLMPEHVEQIKVDTWDYIALDLLKDSYTDIINCFDFDNIDIYLGAWKSESDIQKQSLLSAFRSAFMFTLLSFTYGDDRSLYPNFTDFFEHEFYRRIVLIHGIWKQRKDNEPIKYIPIFDSFYNLEGASTTNLTNIIHSILSDENMVEDEKMLIRTRLIEGAKELHANEDPESIALEQSVIKPVVNFITEIKEADDCILAATNLYNSKLYNHSINRSYYAMMHALKAFLETKKQLPNWNPGILNVNENHKALENKLSSLCLQGAIKHNFVSDFKYVKNKRWAADYNLSIFSKTECDNCINKARDFINEINRMSS